MDDRELLELAAKAARIVGEYVEGYGSGDYYYTGNQDGIRYELAGGGYVVWNPLTDDGDALRLAVKLRIQVTPGTYDKNQFTALNPSPYGKYVEHWHSQRDELAATRRAITRAATLAKGDGKV